VHARLTNTFSGEPELAISPLMLRGDCCMILYKLLLAPATEQI